MNRWACVSCMLLGLIVGYGIGCIGDKIRIVSDQPAAKAHEPLPVSLPTPTATKVAPLSELPIETESIHITHKGIIHDVMLIRVSGQESVGILPMGWDYSPELKAKANAAMSSGTATKPVEKPKTTAEKPAETPKK